MAENGEQPRVWSGKIRDKPAKIGINCQKLEKKTMKVKKKFERSWETNVSEQENKFEFSRTMLLLALEQPCRRSSIPKIDFRHLERAFGNFEIFLKLRKNTMKFLKVSEVSRAISRKKYFIK